MEFSIPKFYGEYGRYIARFRSIPYYIDILTPVERRMLLSAYEIAGEKFVKSATVVGHCMGYYHPHGSSYSTLVKLVNLGLIDGEGGFGNDKTLEPCAASADRYTEVKLTNWLVDMAFKFIKFVPWDTYEFSQEPEFLPCPIPVGLIGHGIKQGISFYKSVIPRYTIQDLKNRMKYLLNKGNKISIKPFVQDNKTITTNIDQLLTTGKSQIKFVANHKYEDTDNKNPRYVLTGLPINTSQLKKFIEDNNINFNDGTSKNTCITLYGKNIDYKKLINALTVQVSFDCIVVNNDSKVFLSSIDEMLLRNYEAFKDTVKRSLEFEMNKNESKLIELDAIREIKEIIKLHKIDNVETLLTYSKRNSKDLIKQVATKYNINTLININTDSTKTQEHILELKHKIDEIDETTYTYLDTIQ